MPNSNIRSGRPVNNRRKAGDPYSNYNRRGSGGSYRELVPDAPCGGYCDADTPCAGPCYCVGGGSGNNWSGTCEGGDSGGHSVMSSCPRGRACPDGSCPPCAGAHSVMGSYAWMECNPACDPVMERCVDGICVAFGVQGGGNNTTMRRRRHMRPKRPVRKRRNARMRPGGNQGTPPTTRRRRNRGRTGPPSKSRRRRRTDF